MGKSKPESERKTKKVSFRLSTEEKEMLTELASEAGMTVPDYLRTLLIIEGSGNAEKIELAREALYYGGTSSEIAAKIAAIIAPSYQNKPLRQKTAS